MLEFGAGIPGTVWWNVEQEYGDVFQSSHTPYILIIHSLASEGLPHRQLLGTSVGSQPELKSWDVLNLEKG